MHPGRDSLIATFQRVACDGSLLISGGGGTFRWITPKRRDKNVLVHEVGPNDPGRPAFAFGIEFYPRVQTYAEFKGVIMIKTMTTAAIAGVLSLSFVAFAQADMFSATPMNPGPPSFMMSSPAPAPMMEKPMMHKTMMKKKKKKMMAKKEM